MSKRNIQIKDFGRDLCGTRSMHLYSLTDRHLSVRSDRRCDSVQSAGAAGERQTAQVEHQGHAAGTVPLSATRPIPLALLLPAALRRVLACMLLLLRFRWVGAKALLHHCSVTESAFLACLAADLVVVGAPPGQPEHRLQLHGAEGHSAHQRPRRG